MLAKPRARRDKLCMSPNVRYSVVFVAVCAMVGAMLAPAARGADTVLSRAAANAHETLTGVVTNTATGRTLEGARVVLQGTGREVFTDSQGVYRFENVPPGAAV